ncbi:TPA: HTH-type transcriptional repressor FabR [Mannheimia haemolytica]|uniref:HTH-type transcriptional repressor FabR n=1 Tax=Mannheimia haemolytica TaxID=75985 RepID=A0A249A285_MANHA|nr:HTH-type transcriptional repressor FabR [Mannheimia haemolytica]AWW72392.1 HTH-type transcriptional repressor FabR [Pasteurellaceae bacterium 12565]AGI33707.1 HTH-type transcriptional repressor FabR [Mannheimia haemolytica USDA-ARS-USMARC-183]AGK01381.1 HTH domain-containing DNA-binding transcriptional repressor FabR [Mannheimia haemolytica M42548]AGQ26211.1 GntR family transcriptional regulator [Mannheimia haemolytica D153]AGQ39172.1 GntR family transcriptional regulator [Mannheimia haemol
MANGMSVRAIQKEKTRRALVEAAFNQLSSEKNFSNLSLREVAREAGVAPTSFYRHFKDMDELGLAMVDESGLLLRQLMRQARKRIANGGSVVVVSVETFFELIADRPNVFQLLLRESSGTSQAFRTAASREIQHFVAELADYIMSKDNHSNRELAYIQSEGLVTLVFTAGSHALDMNNQEREKLKQRVIMQLRMLIRGSTYYANKQASST